MVANHLPTIEIDFDVRRKAYDVFEAEVAPNDWIFLHYVACAIDLKIITLNFSCVFVLNYG